jgi:hypothetical protein
MDLSFENRLLSICSSTFLDEFEECKNKLIFLCGATYTSALIGNLNKNKIITTRRYLKGHQFEVKRGKLIENEDIKYMFFIHNINIKIFENKHCSEQCIIYEGFKMRTFPHRSLIRSSKEPSGVKYFNISFFDMNIIIPKLIKKIWYIKNILDANIPYDIINIIYTLTIESVIDI